jgi:hypothetical protein
MFKLIIAALAAAIAMGVSQASADSLSREFLLRNRSSDTITQVLASNVGDDTFAPIDLLGDETVGPHSSLVIAPFNAQGWCRFDFRITFEGGLQQDVYNVNACEATEVTTYGDRNDGHVRVSYN